MKSLPWILLPLAFFCLAACDTSGEDEDFSKAPLPDAYSASGGICDGPATPPSFEAWTASADAIVFGTVTKIEPLFEPAVVARYPADPPYVDKEDCTGNIEVGLEVVLSDLEVLWGELPPGNLVLTLGKEFVQTFAPMPFCFNGKTVDWVPEDLPGRIGVGQRLGGALYRDPDWGFWGPQKNCGVLMWVEEEQTIRAQDSGNEYCCVSVAEGVDGLSLVEFRSLLAALDLSDPAVQEEIERRRTWYNDPLSRLSQYWGATCFPGPECQRDSDCDQGLLCRDGFCGPECGSDADCGVGEGCVDGSCEVQ